MVLLHQVVKVTDLKAQQSNTKASTVLAGTELRGVWVETAMAGDEADIDKWLDIVQAAHLNTIYLTVRFDSNRQFDLLDEWISKAKSRGLEVHAWFTNNGQEDNIPTENKLKPMFGSETWYNWLDHTNPNANNYESSNMLDILNRYPSLDGVMFDYIRFDGTMGSVQNATKTAALADGYNLDVIVNDVYGALPVPTPDFCAHTGDDITTAKVLAQFDNGLPAITINTLGSGASLIFHWFTQKGVWEMPLVAKTAKIFLAKYGKSSDMYVENVGEGGEMSAKWAQSMGYNPIMVEPSNLGNVPKGAPIVIGQNYGLSNSEASALKKHAENGGLVIFFEPPVNSMGSATVQQLVGFTGSGYFDEIKPNRPNWMRITADGTANGLPVTSLSEAEQDRLAKGWIKWQKDQITKIVSTVHNGVASKYTNKYVSACVFRGQTEIEDIRQDWDKWTANGLLEHVMPMAYVSDASEIPDMLPWWKSFDPNMDRVTPGIGIPYINASGSALVDNIKTQVDTYRNSGAKGFVLFALHYIGDMATAKLIGERVFPGTVAPYHPGVQPKPTQPPTGPASVNDGTGVDVDTQNLTTELSANWPAATDAVSGIARYEYAIGTTAKGVDVKGWTSAVTATNVTVTGLSLKVGTTYYVSARAVNGAGLTGTVVSSDGVKIVAPPATQPPTGPVSISDGTGTDVDIQESTTAMSANWPAATDAANGIARYEYAIGTTAKGTNVKGWTSAGTATKVTVTGLSLKVGTTYYVSARAVNGAGLTGTVVSSDGVKIVIKPSSPASVNDGTGVDVDTQDLTTELSANWPAATDAVSGIARYEYAIGTTAKGVDVKGWASAGTATKVTVTGLSLKVGTTYYVSVRAVNGVGLTGTVVSSDGVKIVTPTPKQPPTGPASVNDGTGVDVDTQNLTTELSANWPAATDAVSGIARYEYSIGTTAKGVDVKGWTSAGTVTNVTVTGLSLKVGTTYYVSVRAVNGAGLTGTIVSSDGVKIIAPPAKQPPKGPVSVNDGTGTDVDIQESTTSLSANWPAATDAANGIARYEYSIGTTAKGVDFKGWTSTGTATSVTVTSLNLKVGKTYYINVRAVNGDGLIGTVVSSDGVKIVAKPSSSASVNDGMGTDVDIQESKIALSANWSAVTDAVSSIARYEYAIGTTAKGTDVKGWTSAGTSTNVTITGLSLTLGKIYYVSVRAVNGVGLTGPINSSDGVKIVAKPTAPASVNDGTTTDVDTQEVTTSLSANWPAATDVVSGIARYEYAIGTSTGGTDLRGWTSIGSARAVTAAGLNLNVGTTYYVSVRAVNGVGLPGAAASSDGVKIVAPVPKQPPVGPGSVSDGMGSDIDVQESLATLSANWPAARDAVTGIARYEYAIGTTAKGVDVKGWTSVGTATYVTVPGLSLKVNATYFVSVRAVNGAGLTGTVVSSDGVKITSKLFGDGKPNDYELGQNYPNPFNPTTKIPFMLKESGVAKLTIFDAIGRMVKTLVMGGTAGYNEYVFDASELGSGLYFYRLEANSFVATRKMILMK
ncbi:MAG: T9SS type A sorting domain-containing protein [Desulfobulbaceae bacterium]|nr:T9SS type A sorting domain-containing protein [Desulfobulbaceae bacterium]